MSDIINTSPPREKRTLVEEGTEFEGMLSSRCPIDVMGKVKGDVTGPSIHISATGVLDGTVKVSELRSEGELAGSVDADKVQLSGRVRDKTVIRASAIEVKLEREEGKMEIVFGECQLEIGAQPNKEEAIAAALHRDHAAPIVSATASEQPSPPVTAPAPPSVEVEARAGRADEATIESKSLPPADAWNLPATNAPGAGPSEPAATEANGDQKSRRERRRRDTLPPPPR